MQRMYGKNDMKEKEFYELREPSRPSTDRHPDLYKKAETKMTGAQFTIPSSSHMIEKEVAISHHPSPPSSPSHPSPTYNPIRSMRSYGRSPYYQEDQQQPPHYNIPSEITSPRNLHCIVIADHIVDCPICSRFYRNYTPIYNVIIFILVVILMIMIIRMNRPPISPSASTTTLHPHRLVSTSTTTSPPPPTSSFL